MLDNLMVEDVSGHDGRMIYSFHLSRESHTNQLSGTKEENEQLVVI